MRYLRGSIVSMAGACVLGLGAPAAWAQPGDLCNDPIPVTEGSYPFDSTGYATEGESDCAPSGSDIWFIYTPSATGVVNIDTCGSSFDTVLSVVLDCSLETLCNDDACSVQSILSGVVVNEGISIFIRVAEYGGSGGGPGVLNINVEPPSQWDEHVHGGGDSGEIPHYAQTPTGTDPLTEISGVMEYSGDTDLYLINVCDVGAFTAATYPGTNDALDTRLYLFTLDGHGVTFNDDVPDGYSGDDTLLSRISGQFVSAPGDYYLAVTMYANAPVNLPADLLWNETPYNVERAPDGPGAADQLSEWTQQGFDLGLYRIALTGACFHTDAPPCDPDVTQDGNVDQDDVTYLINVIGGGDNPTGIDPDFTRDGNVDQDDVTALINTIGGGGCP